MIPYLFRSGIRRRFFRVFILLLLLQDLPVFTAEPEELAPTFYLPDINGNKFFASKIYGPKAARPTPVVFSFFASWCIPCKAEIPILNELASNYPDILFYLINLQDSREIAQKWVKVNKTDLPILMDRYGVAAERFGVVKKDDNGVKAASVPALFVINREGKIVFEHHGYQPGDEKELIQTLELIKNNTLKE
jgi:thiol-disulfide isomerase/thioredoxin